MIADTKILLLVIILSVVVRVWNFSFPFFTPDEARIAYRGYTIANKGVDELGRKYPLIFNSSYDYQLPVSSYLTALGILIFGKNDFGARIPFIIMGLLLVILVYKLAKFFLNNNFFAMYVAVIVGLSPAAIFLSKIPNDIIILTCLFVLLFHLLTKSILNKINIFLILLVFLLIVLTSKYGWFILPLFTLSVVYFYSKFDVRKKILFVSLAFFFSIISIAVFLNAPQSKRSLSENNFSLFTNLTISNGINRLRGQGIEVGVPEVVEKIYFNKSMFLSSGFLHWLSNISPKTLFGQSDRLGIYNFSHSGLVAKILIICFVLGSIFIVKEKKFLPIILLIMVTTLPATFVYPNLSYLLIFLTLPWIAIITAFGLSSKPITKIFITFIFIEILLTIFNLELEIKNTNNTRPVWIKSLVNDMAKASSKVVVSDNIISDIGPYIFWFNNIDDKASDIKYPYKILQTQLVNITIINSEESFIECAPYQNSNFFVSDRDLKKIGRAHTLKIRQTYYDSLGNQRAYFIEVCEK